MADQEFIEQLRETRPGYEPELVWQRFLLDAYASTGGFCGKVKQPRSGYWGWAAEVYSASSWAIDDEGSSDDDETYLDRFPREDEPKFKRRRDVAHYENFVEGILDLLVSYVLRERFTIEPALAELDKWKTDVDGQGTTWDEMRDEILVPRSALLGWAPCLVDMPPTPVGPEGAPLKLSVAQAESSAITPRLIPLFPANLLDWACDDTGTFEWLKIRTDRVSKPSPFEAAKRIERYTVWYRDRVEWYEVTVDGDGGEVLGPKNERKNPFGEVPVAIWRHKKVQDDPVRGIGMVGSIATENRRHFNLLSELDEHLRSQVFAILQVPVEGMDKIPGEVTSGNGNALPIPMESSQPYAYVAPPASVADTYEVRLENTVKEIFRMARIEYLQATGDAESGISRAWKFEQTNRRLGDFAKQIARGELWTYALVMKGLGNIPDDRIAKQTVTAPTNFAVQELLDELEKLIKAIGMRLGATATAALKKRAVEKILPNLPTADMKTIEREIDELAQQDAELEASMAAFAGEMDDAAPPGEGGGDDEDPQVGGKKSKPPRKKRAPAPAGGP